MSRDIVFETVGRGDRALVERALRRGDRVFIFDFGYRLRSRPWLRALINADRVTRIFVPPSSHAEGASFGATAWLAPRFMRHGIVKSLSALYGVDEVAPIVKKALLDELFEHLFMRAWLAAHLAGDGRGRSVVLVARRFRRWERLLAGWPDRPEEPLRGLRVPRGSSAWSRAFRRVETIARAGKVAAVAAVVLAARRRGAGAEPVEVEHLYAVDQPFQTNFQGPRRFSFLLDGVLLHAKNTAFVVHPSAEGPWIDEARRDGFLVFSRRELCGMRAMLRTLPSRARTRGVARVLRAIARRPHAPEWLVDTALLGVQTHLAVATLADHVRFTSYVYTNQDGLDQRWHNVMARRLGARSWNYVLSIGAGYVAAGGTDLLATRDPLVRHRLHAYQNPDHFVVPSRQLADYHRQHDQAVGRYHAIGNIFSELILNIPAEERRALRHAWFGPRADGAKVISWFDTSFVEAPLSSARHDEAVVWYDEILRLADARPDLLMLLKPSKKEWYFKDTTTQWWHPKGAAVLERWARARAHPRVHFVGPDADPSAVAAASDLTITFCYSSPTAEALGARRRGLWYDPCGRWRGTLYDRDVRLVAHGWDELVRAVRWALDEASDADYDTFLDTVVRGRVEDFLDGKGLSRFRALLAESVGRP